MSALSKLEDLEDGLLMVLQARAALVGSALAGVAVQLGDPGANVHTEHVWISEAAIAEWTPEVTGDTPTFVELKIDRATGTLERARAMLTTVTVRCTAYLS